MLLSLFEPTYSIPNMNAIYFDFCLIESYLGFLYIAPLRATM